MTLSWPNYFTIPAAALEQRDVDNAIRMRANKTLEPDDRVTNNISCARRSGV